MKNRILFGHLLTLVTIIIWGTTFVSTKILLREFNPVEILFYRFLIAFLLLWIIYPKSIKVNNLREELLFLGLGLSGITLYFLVENIALQFTLAANVGLLISAAPILTATAAHFTTPDEKFKQNLLIGFLAAFVGIFLVIFNGKFVLKINPLGDFLALLASIVWAVYSVLLKKVNQAYHPVFIVRKTFFYGLLTIWPLLLLFKADFRPEHSMAWTTILNILFLGIFASALCFVMWNQAVKLIGVVKTSNYIYLVPLITMITSIIILHEKVNWLMILGGVLIFGGVYIAEHGLKVKVIADRKQVTASTQRE